MSANTASNHKRSKISKELHIQCCLNSSVGQTLELGLSVHRPYTSPFGFLGACRHRDSGFPLWPVRLFFVETCIHNKVDRKGGGLRLKESVLRRAGEFALCAAALQRRVFAYSEYQRELVPGRHWPCWSLRVSWRNKERGCEVLRRRRRLPRPSLSAMDIDLALVSAEQLLDLLQREREKHFLPDCLRRGPCDRPMPSSPCDARSSLFVDARESGEAVQRVRFFKTHAEALPGRLAVSDVASGAASVGLCRLLTEASRLAADSSAKDARLDSVGTSFALQARLQRRSCRRPRRGSSKCVRRPAQVVEKLAEALSLYDTIAEAGEDSPLVSSSRRPRRPRLTRPEARRSRRLRGETPVRLQQRKTAESLRWPGDAPPRNSEASSARGLSFSENEASERRGSSRQQRRRSEESSWLLTDLPFPALEEDALLSERATVPAPSAKSLAKRTASLGGESGGGESSSRSTRGSGSSAESEGEEAASESDSLLGDANPLAGKKARFPPASQKPLPAGPSRLSKGKAKCYVRVSRLRAFFLPLRSSGLYRVEAHLFLPSGVSLTDSGWRRRSLFSAHLPL